MQLLEILKPIRSNLAYGKHISLFSSSLFDYKQLKPKMISEQMSIHISNNLCPY